MSEPSGKNSSQAKPSPGDRVSAGDAVGGRRAFGAEVLALVCGGLATLTPVAAGLWMFLDPLRKRSAAAEFLPVAQASSIPADGVPRQFPVVADRLDAWTGFASEPIGAVYLCRQKVSGPEQGSGEVQAFSATCPHAGCFVEIDPVEKCFRCPCHNSKFTFDGSMVAPSPSPRAMDALECRIEKNGEVVVKWENFYTGIAGKVPRL